MDNIIKTILANLDLSEGKNNQTMSSEPAPNIISKQSLLQTIKVISTMPAQMLFYGTALLAIAATGGVALPGVLETLATTVGINVLSSILERVARGDSISDDEIRKTVEEVIQTSGIDNLVTSDEFQRSIAHVFRQFDLLKYAVHKGDFEIARLLSEQFEHYKTLWQELKAEISFVQEQNKEILKSVHRIEQTQKTQIAALAHNFPTAIVDKNILESIDTLRKSRFFIEFDREVSSLTLSRKVIEGEFSGGSDYIKGQALAWCARVLSRSEDLEKAEECLRIAKELGTGPEIEIAQAFIYSQKGDSSKALSILANIDGPSSRSAAVMIVSHHKGFQGVVDWMKAVGISGRDLDPDGKNFLLVHHLQLGQWELARQFLDLLSNEDIEDAPILNHLIAITHLLCTVPTELRTVVLSQLPFEAASFPLASDAPSIKVRQTAHYYFLKATQVAEQLHCSLAATIDDDYALWIELRDPEKLEEGRRRLKAKLRDRESSLRLVHLGLQFGVPLDLETVEQEIDREIAYHGGITQNAAIARFALAFTQKTPEDIANYVARYREELANYFDKKMLQYLEIEMLSKAGLLERAKICLTLLLKEGIPESDESRLRRMISEVEGANPVESKKEQYEKTKSFSDLVALVDELENRKEWDSLSEFGRILFERTHSLADALRLATSLYNTQKMKDLIEFSKINYDLLAHSKPLRMLYCWALYLEGAVIEARSELEKFGDDPDNPNYRALQLNLAISIGDWNSLMIFIAKENSEKDRRSAQELINTAKLALHLKSPLAKELIYSAVGKGKDDASILATAYFLATNAGWEGDADVFLWLNEAVRLSGDDGPMQKKTIRDLLDWKPEWDQRVSDTWRLLNRGEIPMFIAAHFLNKSLIDLTLFPALANLNENDPRRRGVVPAFSGNRQPQSLEISGTVGLEATTLLTLSFLGILDKVLDSFDTIYVPHSTFSWLFEEKQKASFHQPSRIKEAHQIRNLLANGNLEQLIPSAIPDSDLSAQVGDELALLLSEVEKMKFGEDRQHIVVRSSPVHRITSLMEEEADLTPYEIKLSSCQNIVEKLREKGQITAKEEQNALAYLRFQEKPWPNQPKIADNAILYLDSLAVTYFLNIGLLGKLHAAGLKPIISPKVIEETNNLINYESISETVNDHIEGIRSAINSRIERGKMKVGRRLHDIDPDKQSLLEHPTTEVISLAKDCKAVIADDRFLNQQAVIDNGSVKVPIFTTLDLIDGLVNLGSITLEERLDFRSRLRRAGYFFIPVGNDELISSLNASPVKNEKVEETAELKAIRENLLHIRMGTWLQTEKEVIWLDMLLSVFLNTIKNLWKADEDLSYVRAKSDWLLAQMDVRGWVHCFGDVDGDNIVNSGWGEFILRLLTPLIDAPSDIKDEYWNWVEDRILAPIEVQSPNIYFWMVNRYRKNITELVNRYLIELEVE